MVKVLGMVFSRECLAEAIRSLREKGIDGVIIGSTTYMLKAGFKEFEDDVDLFTTSISPSFDDELVFQVANELGCFTGQTEWGTPQLRCPIESCDLIIELYENMFDFYVPEEMISNAETYVIKGVKVKALRVEDYLTLKAKAGRQEDLEDLQFLADLIKAGKLKINKNLILSRLKLFEEYEEKLILRRLREAGIKI